MPELKISSINVGDRFRKKFEDMEALAASIERYGLIEPIVLDEDNNLIAGERRLRAHVILKKELILVRYIKDLNQLEKKEVELEENIQRKAFTWQEEVSAKAQLHKLKQRIHGSAVRGHNSKGWKLKDTAKALGESVGTVSMDVQLARGIKVFPVLAKEKSKTTAYKKLRMLQEKVLHEELAKRLADRGQLDKAFAQMYRILKNDRHMYVFCAIDKIPAVNGLLMKHGFEVHKLPLIWNKTSGSYPSQSTTYVHCYEAFLHVLKGKRKLNGTPVDVFTIKRVPPMSKVHPSQKPTELLRDLIGMSTLPGEKVVDPFAGSGSTIVAAREMNRQALGIEMNIKYHAAICKRLEEGK